METINVRAVGIRSLRYMAAGGLVAAMTLIGVIATSVITAKPAHAAQISSNNNVTLEDLILLDVLFQGEGSIFGSDGLRNNRSGLGQLIALNKVFEDTTDVFGSGGIFSSNTGLLNRASGGLNLEDLILLDVLFQGDQGGIFGGARDDGFTGGIFGGQNGLGQLIVLDRLFNDGGGLFGSNRTVIVEGGDTLVGIAAAVYGDATLWPRIAQANGITDPRTLQVGQTLTIPRIGTSGSGSNNLNFEDLILLDVLFRGGNNTNATETTETNTGTGTFPQTR